MARLNEPLMDMSPSGGGGMTKNDKVKLGLVLGLFLAAGVLLAWHFDIIGGGGVDADPRPPEVQRELEEQAEEQLREAEDDPNVEIGGA